MKRRTIIAVLAALMGLAAAAPAFGHGGPGPGNSNNGKCAGPPSTRIGGC